MVGVVRTLPDAEPEPSMKSAPSQTWTFFEGAWREGNPPIMGPRTHGAWMGSGVFDGARRFEGVFPDLRLHCERVNRSAEAMQLQPLVSVDQWVELALEGARRFAPDVALYIRPMYWPESGFGGGVMGDPASTNWCLSLYEAPMPAPTGATITLSPFRRPPRECAVNDAKAGAHYPNGARALHEAGGRGFSNAVMLDPDGAVAELANANIFMVKDGVVLTPAPTGVFLDGITRQRTIGLLRADGVEVVETSLRYEQFLDADEIFSTGNFQKVAPVRRIETRDLELGPVYTQARALYWDFAHGR
jgi:branched-chain amino acid aminotransferase